MSTGARLPFRQAFFAALDVIHALEASCARIDMAGSLRRCAPDVGDLEILAIAKTEQEPTGDLFGGSAVVSLLERRVAELLRVGDLLTAHPERPANGPKYKRLWWRPAGVQVDLFVVSEATWGPALAIRTGPAELSAALVTKLRTNGMHCEELQVRRGAEVVPCPDERTFFKLCGRPYLPPDLRG
jgi:DNA polymerase/3'-5' exonuclease PolX